MRISVLVVTSAVAATAWFAACGGDDGGTKITDAGGSGSGSGSGSGGAASEGIGKICNATTMCAAGFDCIALTQNATNGICGFPCGSTTNQMPPANGQTICAGATPKSPSGTPVCALGVAGSGSATDWECALACGTYMGQNLGDCPSGLTCQNNLCKI